MRLTFKKKPFENYREQGWDLNYGPYKRAAIIAPYGEKSGLWYWYGGIEGVVPIINTLWKEKDKTFNSAEEAKKDCLSYFKFHLGRK